jgi:hypothetical protein
MFTCESCSPGDSPRKQGEVVEAQSMKSSITVASSVFSTGWKPPQSTFERLFRMLKASFCVELLARDLWRLKDIKDQKTLLGCASES